MNLLVLVPHRDVRRQLRLWSASLFAAGLGGAWSFPWVAPLAIPNRAFSGEEMKALAALLRKDVDLAGGKFTGAAARSIRLTGGLSVYGPLLDITSNNFWNGFADGAIRYRYPAAVIGSALLPAEPPALLPDDGEKSKALPDGLPPMPPVSFRAAALAMARLRPLAGANTGGCSLEWEIGELYWLPKTKRPPINRYAAAHTPT